MHAANDGGNQLEGSQQSTHSWFEDEAAQGEGALVDSGLTEGQDLNWVRDFDKHKAKQGTNIVIIHNFRKKNPFFLIV